jgi:hypothetical protein
VALQEKHIIDYLAGYRLDLTSVTDVELDNLSNDADFYMLDRLKAEVADQLQRRKHSSTSLLQERYARVKGDIHPFSTLFRRFRLRGGS